MQFSCGYRLPSASAWKETGTGGEQTGADFSPDVEV